MCSKHRYLTWDHAAWDARAMRRRKGSKKYGRIEVYRCLECGGVFHVGHNRSKHPKG